MLQFFRSFFNSRIGIFITLGVVGLIALAFAAGDVASSGGFGGVAGGDRAAMVGKTRISTSQLGKAVSQGYENARQQAPGLTMKAFLAEGGVDAVLNQLLDGTAVVVFGQEHGIIAGKRLVDSELAKIPSLQGPDGKFSDTNYRQLLAQRQLTDAEVRADIEQGLVAKEALYPAELGASMPDGMVRQYAALLREKRVGFVGQLPSAAFAPKAPPSDAELGAWYGAHRAAFLRPERRVLRYAIFDAAAVKSVAAPGDAEIAARYAADHAKYAASENRKVTQLVVLGEGAAREILADVGKGQSLEAAAKKRGLATAALGSLTRDALAAQTSADAAAAAFSAHAGAIAGPVKSALGFVLLRVDAVEAHPARSLAQARGDIVTELTAAKRRAALADLTAKIEESFDKGGALSDTAKELGVAPKLVGPLTADGQVFGKPGEAAPKELAKVVQTAFSMEHEGQPQLAELDSGKTFVMFDVTEITPAAPPPLAEVKVAVATQVALEKGTVGARAAALKVLAAAKKGGDLKAALAVAGVPLPAVQSLDMTRDHIPTQNGKIPPVLTLFFSMAQGTVKLMPLPGNLGWAVVQLKAIQPGAIDAKDATLANAASELSQLTAREYAEELRAAIKAEVKVKRNEVAIKAVATQLGGGNGN